MDVTVQHSPAHMGVHEINCHTIDLTPTTSMQPLLRLFSCWGRPGGRPRDVPRGQLCPGTAKNYANLDWIGSWSSVHRQEAIYYFQTLSWLVGDFQNAWMSVPINVRRLSRLSVAPLVDMVDYRC